MLTTRQERTLPELDPGAIQRLRDKAIALPLDYKIASRWLRADRFSFGKWLLSEYGILLKPCYQVIFTIELKDKVRDAQLSVSSLLPVLRPVTIEVVEMIAVAFGLGTRDTWDGNNPAPEDSDRLSHVITKRIER